MRSILFAILVAVPTALVTWMLTRGTGVCRIASVPAASTAASAPAAAPPAATAPERDPDAVLAALLAPPLGTLTLKAEVAFYDAQGLFEYIDGAAPVFIERGFRKLAAVELGVASAAGSGDLSADVYDMQTPANATAIFGFERPPSAQAIAIGDEGHTGRMSLVFRRGRYYVKLTAFNAVAEAELPALARALASRMP